MYIMLNSHLKCEKLAHIDSPNAGHHFHAANSFMCDDFTLKLQLFKILDGKSHQEIPNIDLENTLTIQSQLKVHLPTYSRAFNHIKWSVFK